MNRRQKSEIRQEKVLETQFYCHHNRYYSPIATDLWRRISNFTAKGTIDSKFPFVVTGIHGNEISFVSRRHLWWWNRIHRQKTTRATKIISSPSITMVTKGNSSPKIPVATKFKYRWCRYTFSFFGQYFYYFPKEI